MSAGLIIFSLGLGAALSYGVADFFGAKASKKLGPVTSAFCVHLIGTIAVGLWYLAFVHTMPQLSLETWLYALGGSIFMGLGVCTLYMAFEIGPVSLASPLSAAYPLVTTIIGMTFFQASLRAWQFAGIVLVVFGIMAASGLFQVKQTERKIGRGPQLALATTLSWGLAYPLLGQAVDAVGWQPVTLVQFCIMVPVIGLVLVARRRQERPRGSLIASTLRNPFVIGAGVIQMFADLLINFGFSYDQATGAIVVAISSTYPVLTILLALRHFKEQLERWAMAGAGATICGVVLLLV